MLKPSLQLKQGQSLSMTPQLQQAIRLLQLPVLDLNAQLQEALEQNIMLEIEDPDDISNSDEISKDKAEKLEAEEIWPTNDSFQVSDNSWNYEDQPNLDLPDETNETLQEHLVWQLEIEKFTKREVLIGEALVDSINDDGYLIYDIQEIIESLDTNPRVTFEEAEKILLKI